MGFWIFMGIVLLVCIWFSIPAMTKDKRKKEEAREQERKKRKDFMDTLTPERRRRVERILEITGKSDYFDVRDYERENATIQIATENFDTPGWDKWDDIFLNRTDGQYSRMKRAYEAGQSLSAECYDPTINRAKIQGTSGYYLTGPDGCTCPDFGKRHLPCKHMYYLADKLKAGAVLPVSDPCRKPLRGLNVVLAGRTPKGFDFIGIVTNLGGQPVPNVSGASILVLGNNPGTGKTSDAANRAIPIIAPEMLTEIFQEDAIESE